MSVTVQQAMINCQAARPRPATSVAAMANTVLRTVRLWRSRIRERQAFPVLDERDLRDLRLSRWEVERELAKPFWRG